MQQQEMHKCSSLKVYMCSTARKGSGPKSCSLKPCAHLEQTVHLSMNLAAATVFVVCGFLNFMGGCTMHVRAGTCVGERAQQLEEGTMGWGGDGAVSEGTLA
jgi:hypothetical protein